MFVGLWWWFDVRHESTGNVGAAARGSEQPGCHIMPCDVKTPRLQELKRQACRPLRRRRVSRKVTPSVRQVPLAVAARGVAARLRRRLSVVGHRPPLGRSSPQRRRVADHALDPHLACAGQREVRCESSSHPYFSLARGGWVPSDVGSCHRVPAGLGKLLDIPGDRGLVVDDANERSRPDRYRACPCPRRGPPRRPCSLPTFVSSGPVPREGAAGS
jgi:hypothetical protein